MRFKRTRLKNGIRLILVPKNDSQAATIMILVQAGSKYENKKNNGISHFLEHMCFKGTPRRPRAIDLSFELEALGAQYNAFTSQEYTGYFATVWPKHLHKVVDILADMYLNPLFNEKEIEKEKGVIIEEINMYEDNPRRRVQDLFMELLYGDQPAGWNIAGTKKVVRNIDRGELLDYRRRHYVASATTVIVSGKFDEKKIRQAIEKKFASIPRDRKESKKDIIDRQTKPSLKIKYKKSDQAHLVLGFRTFDIFHRDNYALDVLATVLGGGMSSRLFQRVREELGAAYYVRAYSDSYTDHGFLEISAGADKKRTPEVIEAILAECKRLCREQVSSRELRMVKDYIIGNLYLDLETSSQLSSYYGLQEVIRKKIVPPDEYARQINRVTAGAVRRVAKEIFKNRKLNLAVIGPFARRARFVRVLKI